MLPFISPYEAQIQLANRIKELRLASGWSRAELARRSGVNVNTLIRFERSGEISLSRLLLLAVALGRMADFQSILSPEPAESYQDYLKRQQKRQRGRRQKRDEK